MEQVFYRYAKDISFDQSEQAPKLTRTAQSLTKQCLLSDNYAKVTQVINL